MSVPRFWREIPQRYHLRASRCGVCEAVHYPPRQICPTCRRSSIGHMASVRLSGRGTVLEWTRVHRPAPGYEQQVPYLIVLIAAEEGPLVLGQLVETDGIEVQEGLSVQAVFRRIGEDGEAGIIHYGMKWTPARAASGSEEESGEGAT